MEMEEEELNELMETLFAIFYVDDVYIASRDPFFLQRAIDGLVTVRRDPKVLRRVSQILIKEGLHFANPFYIFE